MTLCHVEEIKNTQQLRHDHKTEEYNVDWKTESGQLNLAHVVRNKKKYEKEETKTNKRLCPLSPVQVQDPWSQSKRNKNWLWSKGYAKETNFKSAVKGRGSDRWWERRRWLWWGYMHRMRWTRRTVNRIRLTERRRELIPQLRGEGCSACNKGRKQLYNTEKATLQTDETRQKSRGKSCWWATRFTSTRHCNVVNVTETLHVLHKPSSLIPICKNTIRYDTKRV